MTSSQMQKVPQPGDPAPDFTARSTSGDNVTLSSFRGKRNVLLAFFPLAFTSTCTEELCDFTRDQFDFGEASVEIIPISGGKIPFAACLLPDRSRGNRALVARRGPRRPQAR